jgi:hypothetical protein
MVSLKIEVQKFKVERRQAGPLQPAESPAPFRGDIFIELRSRKGKSSIGATQTAIGVGHRMCRSCRSLRIKDRGFYKYAAPSELLQCGVLPHFMPSDQTFLYTL